MDDSTIVDLFLSRDESAIIHTKDKYGLKLRTIANHILHNMPSAEECENDTYFEAWNRIPPSEPRTYLFAFLGTIVRHFAIDECRKGLSQKRNGIFCELAEEMEHCLPEQSDIHSSIEAEELTGAINAFLRNCSEDQRNIFIRRYWYFDSVSSISLRYGFTKSKVKTVLHRMREQLRRYLEAEGYSI